MAKFTLFCRRQTLLQLSEQCALQLESGESAEVEQGLEDMKELVVPCLAMLSNSTVTEDGIVVEDIRKKWCSFLGQDVSGKDHTLALSFVYMFVKSN
ncbi:putative ubiquitin carboxyl-terminal hydrolase 25-like [Apostichopus japonicus]|uniref:Putative ubiquitin carboxyl-terminal hydrolase 25-like n=1 Tax=Stichopus japonicus TaxID=307972 RepID=A0A2G8KQU9_STIJA|nr:putative ubiquitin carboxyl-terminal hydrolase 25-like [Apostichopus japonicus]